MPHPILDRFLSWVDFIHPGTKALVDARIAAAEAAGVSITPAIIGMIITAIMGLLNVFFPSNSFIQDLEKILNDILPFLQPTPPVVPPVVP